MMQGQVDEREAMLREVETLKLEKLKMAMAQQNIRAAQDEPAKFYDGALRGVPRYDEVRRDDTPDHLTVGACINLLRNDAEQLLKEIEELRARLSPLLSERDTERVERRGPRPPVRCALAGELEAVYATISNARESIYFTLAQLDL